MRISCNYNLTFCLYTYTTLALYINCSKLAVCFRWLKFQHCGHEMRGSGWRNQNVHKFLGPGKMHPRVLRELPDAGATPLCIFEKSWQSGEVPGDWKREALHLFLKKSRKEDSFFLFNPFLFIEASESLIDEEFLEMWVVCPEEHPELHKPELSLCIDHTSLSHF